MLLAQSGSENSWSYSCNAMASPSGVHENTSHLKFDYLPHTSGLFNWRPAGHMRPGSNLQMAQPVVPPKTHIHTVVQTTSPSNTQTMQSVPVVA